MMILEWRLSEVSLLFYVVVSLMDHKASVFYLRDQYSVA